MVNPEKTNVVCPEKARQLFFKEVDNCYWNPKLIIKILPNDDRTVVATDFIKNDEPLVILNTNSHFGQEKAIQNSKEDLTSLDRSLIIPAYLYQYYTKHTLKYPKGYNYYFDALPTYEWYAENHALLKLYLSFTFEQQKKAEETFFIIKQFNKINEWIKTIPNHELNFEQAVRAILACATRTWNVGLVPWIDFFNHSNKGSFLSNEATTITATHKYFKGDEVNTSYGCKDTLQLLNIYGFFSEEVTLSIPRPPVSPFAVALDPVLKNYQSFSEDNPFLISESLSNIEYLIAHFRLCALNKKDILFLENLEAEYKNFINIENEYNALKIAFICIKEVSKQIERTKTDFLEIINPLPNFWENDLNMKLAILKKLKQRICEYWSKLIEEIDN